jgi:hypothetical protein
LDEFEKVAENGEVILFVYSFVPSPNGIKTFLNNMRKVYIEHSGIYFVLSAACLLQSSAFT